MKRKWDEIIKSAVLRERTCRFEGPVRLRFNWQEANKKRDLDNIAAAKKLVIDGLVEAGVLGGDGWKFVAGFSDCFEVVPDAPGVLVEIEGVEA